MHVKIYNACSLKKAIAFHRQKRKEDNNNVMTVVLKNVQKTAGAKPILDDLIVAMDKGISLCVYVRCVEDTISIYMEDTIIKFPNICMYVCMFDTLELLMYALVYQ